MKLGFLERCYVNSPLRNLLQRPLELRLVTTLVAFPKGAQIMDLGCGNGAGLVGLARRVKPSALTGVDTDPAQLARARRRLMRHNISAQLIEASATHIPLPAHSYDVVTSFGCLNHVEDWQAALAECARLLRHGGLLYTLEFYRPLTANRLFRLLFPHPCPGFNHAELTDAMRRNGFTTLVEKRLCTFAGLTVARLTSNAGQYD